MNDINRYYPFENVFNKLRDTLSHSNGQVRTISQDIVYALYDEFGFEQIKDLANRVDFQGLLPMVKRVPEFEPFILDGQMQVGRGGR